MKNQLETGEIVMCTVERIAGTVVFVKMDNNETGSIVLSEIAPGRIRNLRDYVVPKKRIICKVLRISGNHVDLSLRRVTPKEQKEIREKNKLEKSYQSLLTTVLKDKAKESIKKIKEESTLYEIIEEAKTNSKILEKLVGKTDAQKILEIINNQKKRKIEIKKEFLFHSKNPNGLNIIKKTLGKIEEAKITYISAGKYLIKIETENPKKGDQQITKILDSIEKQAKKIGANFSIREK